MSYFKQKGKSEQFWFYEESELDKVLGKFWFEAKTQKRERYTVASLWHLRYGLNRDSNKGLCIQYNNTKIFSQQPKKI